MLTQMQLERFESKFTKGSGCWTWTASTGPKGYGRFGIQKGVVRLAHRIAYRVYIGPIPAGKVVCHRCDNPSCVNPAHLFVGTQADNLADMVSKGRSQRGERHHRARLTASDVRAIRRRARQGEPRADLAVEFGTSLSNLNGIVRGNRWKHVGLEPTKTQHEERSTP